MRLGLLPRGYHLSGWAESGRALHRAVAVAEIGTAPQEMLMELKKVDC